MTTTSDGSRETVDTTILGDIQLPSHTVNRNRPSDAPQTKCFYCTQDRQKVRPRTAYFRPAYCNASLFACIFTSTGYLAIGIDVELQGGSVMGLGADVECPSCSNLKYILSNLLELKTTC